MNKACSEYLFKEKIYNNEDVFYLIRFALSGNPVGAPMADIAEVIGKAQVEQRIEAAIEVFLK
jgi:glutamyl/glutaminyl-tRNA synthetase